MIEQKVTLIIETVKLLTENTKYTRHWLMVLAIAITATYCIALYGSNKIEAL